MTLLRTKPRRPSKSKDRTVLCGLASSHEEAVSSQAIENARTEIRDRFASQNAGMARPVLLVRQQTLENLVVDLNGIR
jgi:hypothetical protein